MDSYWDLPPITRAYLTASVLTTGACALDLLSPFSLYFSPALVVHKLQLWRIFTNFFFFGAISLDFLFHIFFVMRYSRLLEEGSFRGRSADFLAMLLFGGAIMCAVAPLLDVPPFLGSSLSFMMVYVWSRRNELARMSFLGLFQFRAPYLPWVLLGFSTLLGNSPVIDLIGIGVGHVYYFCEDVFPHTPAGRGRKLLPTPEVLHFVLGLCLSGYSLQRSPAAAEGGRRIADATPPRIEPMGEPPTAPPHTAVAPPEPAAAQLPPREMDHPAPPTAAAGGLSEERRREAPE